MRIISMFGIIILHILGAGGNLRGEADSLNYWVVWFLEIMAYCSVDLFALLSGYLSCDKKKFSSYRIVELLSMVAFYCLLITVIFLCCAPSYVGGIKGIVKALFPFFAGRYWYITCYIALFFLMPYLNILINKMNNHLLAKLCLILVLLFSLIPSLCFTDLFRWESGYSTAWLIVCYILGAYLKRSDKKIFKGYELLIFFASSFAILGVHAMSYFIVSKEFYEVVNYRTANYVFPLILLSAVMLLQLGARMSLKHLNGKLKTFLVFLSTIVFDVYVIHCHILIYNYLITGNFKWILEYHPILIPVLVGLCAVAIFIVCAIIGKLRIILFSLIHLDKGFSWISRRLDKCLEWSD